MGRDDAEHSVLARVEDLQLHFDTDRGVVKALDGVSFDLREAETLALVGETGCGKTITARSFMQLVPTPPGRYVGGRVLLRTDEESCPKCGGGGCEECSETGRHFEDILTRSESEMQSLRGDRIAMIFQDPQEALNPSLTIREQIAESILAHRGDEILEAAGVEEAVSSDILKSLLRDYSSTKRTRRSAVFTRFPPLRSHREAIKAEITDRSIDILRDTKIPNPGEVIDKYPHELSGGMKQRVMIAMALVTQPDLLIADEPTTALDVTTQVRILNLMDELQEMYDTSLLYITHDLNLVNEIADRVVVMYAGQVSEIGPVEQVYGDSKHPYTWGLMDSIPTEDRTEEELKGIEGSIPDLTNPPTGCRFATRCPKAMEHCWTEKPPLIEEDPDHHVACHLYPETASDRPSSQPNNDD